MKGLVLSGGYGTRLRPLTYSQQKQLIPVANKPILFYGLEDIIKAEIKDVGIVVGPNKEQVINCVESRQWNANIEFIYQEEPLGLAHAVKISKDFIGTESFVMYLGDNILKGGIIDHVDEFLNSSSTDASLLLSKVPNPQQFGVAKLNEKGEVIQLLEKPKEPPSNLALVGVYLFKPIIFEAVKNIKPSWRNELEITDAIQWLINNGYKVKSSIVEGWWKDTGKPEDILDVNRLVLDELIPENKGLVEKGVITKGRIKIEKGTVIKGKTVIKGPIIIGENSIVQDSYIGPYTSIGNNCKITDTEIEDSIIMDGSVIENCIRIVDSLIGKNVKIKKSKKLPEGRRLVVGDYSEVEL